MYPEKPHSSDTIRSYSFVSVCSNQTTFAQFNGSKAFFDWQYCFTLIKWSRCWCMQIIRKLPTYAAWYANAWLSSTNKMSSRNSPYIKSKEVLPHKLPIILFVTNKKQIVDFEICIQLFSLLCSKIYTSFYMLYVT